MLCPLESAALNTKKRVIQFGLSKLSWLLFSHYVMSGCLWPHGLQHTRPPCHSPSPRVCPSSCSLMLSSHLILCRPLLFFLSIFLSTRVFSQWVSCLHQVAKGLELQTSASVPPMNIQGWFPLRLTGLISLLSRGLSGVFSRTTVQSKAWILQCSAFFRVLLSHLYMTAGRTTALTILADITFLS